MLGRTRYLLRKLSGLSIREIRELLEAQLALISAQRLVRRRPVGDLLRINASASHEPAASPAVSSPSPSLPASADRARELALAVERAAENGVFRPACLVRALATQTVLEAHGIRGSRIRVGVRQHRGQFLAHAWVEYGALVLGDREGNVAAFADLAELDVAART
jgi:hypothetical protein